MGSELWKLITPSVFFFSFWRKVVNSPQNLRAKTVLNLFKIIKNKKSKCGLSKVLRGATRRHKKPRCLGILRPHNSWMAGPIPQLELFVKRSSRLTYLGPRHIVKCNPRYEGLTNCRYVLLMVWARPGGAPPACSSTDSRPLTLTHESSVIVVKSGPDEWRLVLMQSCHTARISS